MRYSDAKPRSTPIHANAAIVTASYQYGESGSCCRWTKSVAMYGAFGKKSTQRLPVWTLRATTSATQKRDAAKRPRTVASRRRLERTSVRFGEQRAQVERLG